MTRVSDKKLKKDIILAINKQIIKQIAEVKTVRSAEELFLELLTPTERIMLAKRLAIITMLSIGYSFSIIQKTLKVSPSTIGQILRQKKLGKFDFLMRNVSQGNLRNKKEDWVASLEVIIRAGMPPMGRGRWKRTLKIIDGK